MMCMKRMVTYTKPIIIPIRSVQCKVEYAIDDVHQEEDAGIIEANLADLVRTNGVSSGDEEDEEEDEDDTIMEYCSDTAANGNVVHDDVAAATANL